MSLQAPFAHFHPQDADHHHATGFAHMHLGGHHTLSASPATEGLAFEDHDDDETAISQDWVPAGAARVQVLYAEVAVAFVLNPVVTSVGVPSEFTVRSHDPPGQRLLPPRAPPV